MSSPPDQAHAAPAAANGEVQQALPAAGPQEQTTLTEPAAVARRGWPWPEPPPTPVEQAEQQRQQQLAASGQHRRIQRAVWSGGLYCAWHLLWVLVLSANHALSADIVIPEIFLQGLLLSLIWGVHLRSKVCAILACILLMLAFIGHLIALQAITAVLSMIVFYFFTEAVLAIGKMQD